MISLTQWNRSGMSTETYLIQCLLKFVESVNAIFPGRLHQIILYGSYARGTWQDSSDVDVALIMESISVKDVVDKIVDLAVDLEYEYGFCISPIGIDINDLNINNCKLLYKSIRNEGIIIWKKSQLYVDLQ